MPVMVTDEYDRLFGLEDNLWLFKGIRRIVLDSMRSRMAVSKNGGLRILDAGCGTGAMLNALRAYGRPVGADVSPLAVKLCTRRGLRDVMQASVVSLPFEDKVFEAVVSVDMLQCLEGKHDEKALREMWRVCRPRGYLFLWVTAHPLLYGPHDKATGVVRRFRRTEIVEKVRQAGFVVEKVSYTNMFLFPAIVAVKLFRKFFPTWWSGPSDLFLPPRPINALLTSLLSMESVLCCKTSLPIGLSHFVIGYRSE